MEKHHDQTMKRSSGYKTILLGDYWLKMKMFSLRSTKDNQSMTRNHEEEESDFLLKHSTIAASNPTGKKKFVHWRPSFSSELQLTVRRQEKIIIISPDSGKSTLLANYNNPMIKRFRRLYIQDYHHAIDLSVAYLSKPGKELRKSISLASLISVIEMQHQIRSYLAGNRENSARWTHETFQLLSPPSENNATCHGHHCFAFLKKCCSIIYPWRKWFSSLI